MLQVHQLKLLEQLQREHVAFCGYHGWHDWFIANTNLDNGIPKNNKKLTHSFNFNDIDSLRKIFKKIKIKLRVL